MLKPLTIQELRLALLDFLDLARDHESEPEPGAMSGQRKREAKLLGKLIELHRQASDLRAERVHEEIAADLVEVVRDALHRVRHADSWSKNRKETAHNIATVAEVLGLPVTDKNVLAAFRDCEVDPESIRLNSPMDMAKKVVGALLERPRSEGYIHGVKRRLQARASAGRLPSHHDQEPGAVQRRRADLLGYVLALLGHEGGPSVTFVERMRRELIQEDLVLMRRLAEPPTDPPP